MGDEYSVSDNIGASCAGRAVFCASECLVQVLLTAEEKKKSSSLDQSSGTFHSDMAKLDLEVRMES